MTENQVRKALRGQLGQEGSPAKMAKMERTARTERQEPQGHLEPMVPQASPSFYPSLSLALTEEASYLDPKAPRETQGLMAKTAKTARMARTVLTDIRGCGVPARR